MVQHYAYVINIVAGIFLATAQTIYIIQIIKKQITPSLFTWMGWSVLVGVALLSQLIEYGWNWTLMGHLFSAIGCTMIFVVAWITKNYVILSRDWPYLYLGLACIILYLLFVDPWSTTIFAIVADAVLGMPTILKAAKEPKTEKTAGWNIALVCWTLTLITCNKDQVLFFLFPAYCFLFNASMVYLTTNRRIKNSTARLG